jgi:iron(III) transport system substrate-binding protein
MLPFLALVTAGAASRNRPGRTPRPPPAREGAVVILSQLPAGQRRAHRGRLQRRPHPDIKVGEVRLPSGAFYPRFAAEYAGGKSEADACSASWDERLHEWAKQGWMAERQPPEAAGLPEDPGSTTGCGASRPCADDHLYHSQGERGGSPQDWPDLFDPKWKGRIGMNPPWRLDGTADGAGVSRQAVWAWRLGREDEGA